MAKQWVEKPDDESLRRGLDWRLGLLAAGAALLGSFPALAFEWWTHESTLTADAYRDFNSALSGYSEALEDCEALAAVTTDVTTWDQCYQVLDSQADVVEASSRNVQTYGGDAAVASATRLVDALPGLRVKAEALRTADQRHEEARALRQAEIDAMPGCSTGRQIIGCANEYDFTSPSTEGVVATFEELDSRWRVDAASDFGR